MALLPVQVERMVVVQGLATQEAVLVMAVVLDIKIIYQ
jgi:hypothetical protein